MAQHDDTSKTPHAHTMLDEALGDSDDTTGQRESRKSLNVLLTIVSRFKHDHPRFAGTLLYLVAHGAAIIEDIALSLEYMGYVSNGFVNFPEEVRQVFEENMDHQRTCSAGSSGIRSRISAGIMCSTVYIWDISSDEQVLMLRKCLEEVQIDKLRALPANRKEEWLLVSEALAEDAAAYGGDDECVREAFAQVQAACAERSASLENDVIELITLALMAIGKIEGKNTISAIIEFGLQFLPFLKGEPVLKQSKYFPKMNEVMRRLVGEHGLESEEGEEDDSAFVM